MACSTLILHNQSWCVCSFTLDAKPCCQSSTLMIELQNLQIDVSFVVCVCRLMIELQHVQIDVSCAVCVCRLIIELQHLQIGVSLQSVCADWCKLCKLCVCKLCATALAMVYSRTKLV